MGIKIEWNDEKKTVKLSQRAHIEKFLREFGFDPENVKKVRTPIPLNYEFKTNDGEKVPTSEWDYFKWVGFANWLVTNTRPDFALVTNMCGRYSNNPSADHVKVQKHALRYLASTMDEGITYHGSRDVLMTPYDHRCKLIGFVDSNYGVGNDTMCVSIMMNGGVIVNKVIKQRVVSTSTTHSESMALAAGVKEILWMSDFMKELGNEQGVVRLSGDNRSANLQSTGDYKSSKSDHYRKIQFYVEDNVTNGVVWIDQIPTKENIADIGTKQVAPIEQFERLRDIMMGKTPLLFETEKVKDIKEGKYDDAIKKV